MQDEHRFSGNLFCACDSNGTHLLILEYEHNLMVIWKGFEELSIDTSPIYQL